MNYTILSISFFTEAIALYVLDHLISSY